MMVSPTGVTTLIDNLVLYQSKKGDFLTKNKYGYDNRKKIIVNKADNKETFYI